MGRGWRSKDGDRTYQPDRIAQNTRDTISKSQIKMVMVAKGDLNNSKSKLNLLGTAPWTCGFLNTAAGSCKLVPNLT